MRFCIISASLYYYHVWEKMNQIRKSPSLIEWREALAKISEHVKVRTPVRVALIDALGLISAEQVVSPVDLPLFASSALDGFAVRAAEVASANSEEPTELKVIGEARAGAPFRGEVGYGEAVEIMTGAPIPAGADTIVRIEDTRRPRTNIVQILKTPPPGTGVRPAGVDLRKGDVIIAAGERLTPGLLAHLASAGIGYVSVYPRPKVAICVTGDELTQPGAGALQPADGLIFDSNSVMLSALLREMGADIVDVCTAPDHPAKLKQMMESLTGKCDVLVMSGAVSMGKHDHVRPVFFELGGQEIFWGVNQQPGKPLFFGKLGEILFFGLPGNPVSAYMCADIYVRSALRKLGGDSEWEPFGFMVKLGEDFTKNDSRTAFRRAVLRRNGKQLMAYSAGPPDSNLLHTVARFHGYVVVPAELARIREGDPALFVVPELCRLGAEPIKSLLRSECRTQ
jgi:molybdopterin molybdotransferase